MSTSGTCVLTVWCLHKTFLVNEDFLNIKRYIFFLQKKHDRKTRKSSCCFYLLISQSLTRVESYLLGKLVSFLWNSFREKEFRSTTKMFEASMSGNRNRFKNKDYVDQLYSSTIRGRHTSNFLNLRQIFQQKIKLSFRANFTFVSNFLNKQNFIKRAFYLSFTYVDTKARFSRYSFC